MQLSADEAAKRLPELIDAVLAGEEVLIVADEEHAVSLHPVRIEKKETIRVVI